MHNKVMLKKVVLSPSSDGSTRLHIDQIDSGSIQSTPGNELQLGSQDLIRFAAYAAAHEFKVVSFMISDSYLVPLSEEEQNEVSDSLVDLLNLYGGNEVQNAMQDEFDGLYVVGVNLIDLSNGMRISVRRRGFIQTSIIKEAEKLLSSAWQELELF